ncbi:Hemin transport protein HemS [Oligella sp. MSHR50489EDL]
MSNLQELKSAAEKLLQEQPKLRTLDVANQLGVKERDLVEAECCGIKSTYLGEDTKNVFKALPGLGEVMALSRNPWCVHERHGEYQKLGIGESSQGIVLGPDIDLRLFFDNWGTAWLVEQGGRQSIQFFDRQGMAIHKVYITDSSNTDGLAELVETFKQEKSNIPAYVEAVAKPTYKDVTPALREEWLQLKDTHDFHPLLKKHEVRRLDALKGAGEDLAQQLPKDAIETVLNAAVEKQLPIMCFVANNGIVQIHGGPIHKLLRTGHWFNILDPKFNLHLNTNAIDSLWVVNKPTEDGPVTSLEAYTAQGNLIVQFFGLRKPGIPENPEWRALLESLCTTPLAA